MKLKICTDDFLEVCGKRGVCMLLVFGIALVIAGIVLLAVTQIVLWKKIKKFKTEVDTKICLKTFH